MKADTIFTPESGTDAARIKELQTSEAWKEAFAGFSWKARYHAAYLAVHSWSVFLVDGRMALTSKYGGGHWLAPDCTTTKLTKDEEAAIRALRGDH
jgi:hypothetical protein